MSECYSFVVNGVPCSTEEEKPLLRYLRDELRLTSVKDGCSEGACGTCTILVDGKAVKACVLSTKRAAGKEIVTVEDELENVKSYMEIQQIRNADLFEYEIDCQVNAKGNKILKLILQPLVENAVKYGFSEIYEGGYIRIRITEENDVLVLSVYNTGMPMNKDMVEKINGLTHLPISQIKKAFPDKKHGYGVFNILTRLRLKYGDKITYYYETTDASTTCTIKVPKGGEQES